MYKIPERLKNIECYNPVTKPFRIRLDAKERLPGFAGLLISHRSGKSSIRH